MNKTLTLEPETLRAGSITESSGSGDLRPRHVPALDGLRGVAVSLVAFFHSFGHSLRGIPGIDEIMRVSSGGWCGVDLFFVLSGFLLTRILLATKEKPHFLRNFYCRRMLRIFPLYYATMAVCGIVFLLCASKGAELNGGLKVAPWFALYGMNVLITLQQAWLPETILNLNHCWSLCVEEHFYLFWPLVILVVPRKYLTQTCLGLVVMGLIARTVYVLNSHDYIAPYMFTPIRLDAILMGAALASLLGNPNSAQCLQRAAKPLVLFGLIPIGTLIMTTGFEAKNIVLATVGYTVIAVFFASVVLFLATESKPGLFAKFLTTAPMLWLGKRSYALYLFHSLVMCALVTHGFQDMIHHVTHSSTIGFFASRFAAVPISLALAALSWRYFEEPVLRLKERFN